MQNKLLLLFLSVVLFSCNKNSINGDNNLHSGSNEPFKNYRAAVYSTPTAGGAYSPLSSSGVTLNGATGSYAGGYIRARVISQSGNTLTIQVSRQNGTSFPLAGTAKLKKGAVSGTTLASSTYISGAFTINIVINISLTRGLLHLYPVIETVGGAKYYSEPILVYTIPTYNTGTPYNGYLFGTVDDVQVVASAVNNLNASPPYSVNQCTEFCRKYYQYVYGINFTLYQAGRWWSYAPSMGLTYLPAGAIPRVGDILEFTKTADPWGLPGHVMIITELVGTTQIKVTHQNGGLNTIPIGGVFQRSGNNIIPWGGYTYKGLLRKP